MAVSDGLTKAGDRPTLHTQIKRGYGETVGH